MPGRSLPGNSVDGVAGLVNLHIGGHCLNQHKHDNGKQGGEQRTEHIVLAAVLGHLDHLGNDEPHHIHPCNGASERKTGDDGVEGLSLELKSDT